MYMRSLTLPALFVSILAGGCATGQVGDHKSASAVRTSLVACYGYGCRDSINIPITAAVADRFASIMAAGAASPEQERAALSNAVQYYEKLAIDVLHVRDLPKSPLTESGKKGQMDCIDESTNTRHVMLYLQSRGLLKHHKVEANASRGVLIDGRYPHWTAAISDSSGKKWAVDSWFEPGGGAPDIVPLDYWRTRGVMGER